MPILHKNMLSCRHWVTPKPGWKKPIHRWFLFPHSFDHELVHSLIDEWGLTKDDVVLDPFVGAGTTILSSMEKDISATGYDISPLSVLISRTKCANYNPVVLKDIWLAICDELERKRPAWNMQKDYPSLVRRALPEGRLEEFDRISHCIDSVCPSSTENNFFSLALLAVLSHHSHAVRDGGWLRWLHKGAPANMVTRSFKEQAEKMLSDLSHPRESSARWKAEIANARSLPVRDGMFSAAITSPPYPNRHDYTRIFAIELMFHFVDWEDNRAIRRQSMRSHPEARLTCSSLALDGYRTPSELVKVATKIDDKRIQGMLKGYFEDMYLVLREMYRVCRTGAKIALVLGNVRYAGICVLVDDLTVTVGEQAGLACREIRTIRWRGNSAQQMGRFGRYASRESLVIFQKT